MWTEFLVQAHCVTSSDSDLCLHMGYFIQHNSPCALWQMVSGRAGLPQLGLRGLRSVATNDVNAPTAMDWEKLADVAWGTIETDFMLMAKCAPEVNTDFSNSLSSPLKGGAPFNLAPTEPHSIWLR